jgi:hypothetical protein
MFRTPMSLDRANRYMTALAALLVVAVVVVTEAFGRTHHAPAALVVVVMALAWAMSPRALVVDEREVCIERRMWPALRIARGDITNAATVDSLGKKALRLFGVGGFFGSYGLFWSDTFGRFRLYGTHRGQAVVVVRKGTQLPVIVTPDDVAGTIEAIGPRPLT